MPAKNEMCERCAQRPGKPWDGTGGFTCLCGPCKLKIVLTDKFATKLSSEATLATGEAVTVKFDVTDNEGDN